MFRLQMSGWPSAMTDGLLSFGSQIKYLPFQYRLVVKCTWKIIIKACTTMWQHIIIRRCNWPKRQNIVVVVLLAAAGLSFLFLVVSCSPLHSATGSIPFSLESLYTNVSWNYMYMTRHQRTNSKQKTKQKSSE